MLYLVAAVAVDMTISISWWITKKITTYAVSYFM